MNEMKTSQKGLEFITRWEGLILNPYLDVASLWTIGVGHLIKPTDSFSTITNDQVKSLMASKDKNHPVAKLSISRDEALSILAKDVAGTEDALRKAIKVPLNQNQFDALVSFGFNCGPGVFRTSGACKALNEGNYAVVPEKLLDWSKARIGGVMQVNKGLYNRRVSEGELFSRDFVEPVPAGILIPWNNALVLEVQNGLKKLGLYAGVVDGIVGPATRKGIEEFSKSKGLVHGDLKTGIFQEWKNSFDAAST